VVIFRIDGKESRIATIVIRGSTDNYMDDIERAIDDGVNTFKGITRVSFDMHVQRRAFTLNLRGLHQLVIMKIG